MQPEEERALRQQIADELTSSAMRFEQWDATFAEGIEFAAHRILQRAPKEES